MSDSYYSLDEASQKLGKNADELRELAKVNGISELRDGSKILYKKEDIDALEGQSTGDESTTGDIGSAEESILELASLDEEDDIDIEIDDDMEKMIELSDADTAIEMDTQDETESGFSDDSLLALADTMESDAHNEPVKAPEQEEVAIDADADLGSAEEGSGILDLSLQADDSQLGVVLDGILPSGDDDFGDLGDFDLGFDDAAKPAADELGASEPKEEPLVPTEDELEYEEPEQVVTPQAMQPGIPVAAAMARTDEEGTAFGFAMLLPFVSVVLVTLILLNLCYNGAEPLFMPFVRQNFIYITGGIALLTLIISIVGAAGGSARPASAKNAKAKKGAKQKKAKGKKKK
ncbi:MAG: helix-turn-helix domain-containing protein [Phycisphaerae bacterium]|jgi:hypothetical protein